MNPNEVDALPNWALRNCAPGSFSCLTQTGDGSSSHSQNKFFETCLGQGLWTKYTPNILPEFSVRGPSAKTFLEKVGLEFVKSRFPDRFRDSSGWASVSE